MKARDIWELTSVEVKNKLEDTHAELFNLRFQFLTGQMQNNARLRQVKREIARLSTILRAKEMLGSAGDLRPSGGKKAK